MLVGIPNGPPGSDNLGAYLKCSARIDFEIRTSGKGPGICCLQDSQVMPGKVMG